MKINILIVDDSKSTLSYVQSLLRKISNFFTIVMASSAKEGLEVVKKDKIDLIILDIQMPDINGLEMAKLLKSDKKTSNIPIVFLTASTKLKTEGLELGAVDYLTKPIDEDQFNCRILLYTRLVKSIRENMEKDKQIQEQSKLAQMGEMLNMIAHQWRQPLNAMSASAINLSLKNEFDMLDKESIEDTSRFIQQETQKMSKVINDFMEFNKPEKNTEFLLFDAVSPVVSMISSQFKNRNISLELDIDKELKVFHNLKSIEHVILNLMMNSKDAFEEKNIDDKKIKIFTTTDEEHIFLHVKDNAGGIAEDIIDKVFNPYFTTKEQGKGTGIGLYMSKQMIESINKSSISVETIDNTTLFSIKFKKVK